MARGNHAVTNYSVQTASEDARARIVKAGIRCIIQDGLSAASMAAIAAEADVSKALLHYHFADRAQLLSEIVALLGRRLIVREQGALKHEAAASSVDALWRWIEGELERGELRALLELGTVREKTVLEAVREVSAARRDIAAETVSGLFTRLGLTLRVPATLIADASVAFADGLALDKQSGRDARVSFDVFWLAMLSLGD